MTHDPAIDEVLARKQQLRAASAAIRGRQTDGEVASREIFRQLAEMPSYRTAQIVMIYLDIRSEVRTRWFIPSAWREGKTIAVPYCAQGEIQLFRLQSFDDLLPGTMGVLEPKPELRGDAGRSMKPTALDFVVAPGLAFDRRGGRLGYGKGYYDRLLHCTRPDVIKAGVCFDCQLVSEVPLLRHDIRMDAVVTETAVYRADGTSALHGV